MSDDWGEVCNRSTPFSELGPIADKLSAESIAQARKDLAAQNVPPQVIEQAAALLRTKAREAVESAWLSLQEKH